MDSSTNAGSNARLNRSFESLALALRTPPDVENHGSSPRESPSSSASMLGISKLDSRPASQGLADALRPDSIKDVPEDGTDSASIQTLAAEKARQRTASNQWSRKKFLEDIPEVGHVCGPTRHLLLQRCAPGMELFCEPGPLAYWSCSFCHLGCSCRLLTAMVIL